MAEYVPRLFEKYKKEVAPYLQKKFGYKNVHEIPKVVKISVNAGVGEAIQDSGALEAAMNALAFLPNETTPSVPSGMGISCSKKNR